ncbi:MAG: hypothetical protein WCV62_01810 [Candidatus Peribacteraceae bacterium]|jgi:hypothetical protein
MERKGSQQQGTEREDRREGQGMEEEERRRGQDMPEQEGGNDAGMGRDGKMKP